MHKGDNLDPNQWGNSRRNIIEQCDASLKRLNTDWIDLYQIHRPHPDCAIDETLRALDDLVRAGKVRYIGCSTFAAWQLVESLWAAERWGLNRFVTEQPPYNLLDRRIERELIPACQTYGFGIIPWSPLGGGFLTGKYKRQGDQPEGRYADGAHFRAPKVLGNNAAFDAVEGLEKLASEKGCTISQLSLAWVMHQPGITSPILGPRTMEQFEDNLKANDVTITEEDRKRIDAIVPPGSMTVPFYEAMFGPSVNRF
jgi:aryl-alcohol dehydrogenase-like predicted oxidoreductase